MLSKGRAWSERSIRTFVFRVLRRSACQSAYPGLVGRTSHLAAVILPRRVPRRRGVPHSYFQLAPFRRVRYRVNTCFLHGGYTSVSTMKSSGETASPRETTSPVARARYPSSLGTRSVCDIGSPSQRFRSRRHGSTRATSHRSRCSRSGGGSAGEFVEPADAGLRDVHVLIDGPAADADRADDLTVPYQRIAAAKDDHSALVGVLKTVQ